LAFLLFGAAVCIAAPASDKIVNLPGAPANLSFDQYSGYLNVDAKNNRNIFYWLVLSESNPASAPIALWSNGGPGCSGLIGFMTEQGPFHPASDGLTLNLTTYPWNKVANMLFIEAPAGVGFSYSDTPKDYITGDNQTADDNYQAILAFLDKFPEYANNSFYITSESYGGHYMPTLAKAIVDGNSAGMNPKINFKGFAVGNPYTDPHSNQYGTFETFWGHQLVDKITYDSWVKDGCPIDNVRCLELEGKMEVEVGNLNPYALDYPVCNSPSPARFGRAQRYWFLQHSLPEHRRKVVFGDRLLEDYDPCEDNYAIVYLNRADVQAAIHAKPTIWTECSVTIDYNSSDGQNPMEPYYQYLIDGGYNLNILVYSGDDDTVCATSGSQSWIYDLGYAITNSWTSWSYNDDTFGNQVAGYIVQFKGFNFATVHGAGHEVPTYKPQIALELFKKYLSGVW